MNCSLQSGESLKLVKSKKQYLTNIDGLQYLDCISHNAHVGHCHSNVLAAAEAQMVKLWSSHGFQCDKITFLKKLRTLLPDTLQYFFLVNSGAEANDLALRVARTYTMRMDTIVFDEAYHGNFGPCLDISPQIFKKFGREKKEHVHVIPTPDTFRGSYKENDNDSCEKYISEAKKILEKLVANGKDISCFFSELLIFHAGVVNPPRNYFKLLYQLIRQEGGLCIADESQTGLGRLGQCFWGFQYFDVIPDIVTIGESLGNGFPMGAVITTKKVAESLGDFISTFGGNPIACCVGASVLDIIENEKLMASGKAVGRTLLDGLTDLMVNFACIGCVRGMGLCLGIEIVIPNTSQPDADKALQIVGVMMIEHRVIVQVMGSTSSSIVITPPMCFNQQNARVLIESFRKTLEQLSISLKRNRSSSELSSDGDLTNNFEPDLKKMYYTELD